MSLTISQGYMVLQNWGQRFVDWLFSFFLGVKEAVERVSVVVEVVWPLFTVENLLVFWMLDIILPPRGRIGLHLGVLLWIWVRV